MQGRGDRRRRRKGEDLAVRNTLELITRNNEERLDNFDPRADRLPLRGNGKFLSFMCLLCEKRTSNRVKAVGENLGARKEQSLLLF